MPTVPTSIRLPQELYDWLKKKAESENRTISNTIIHLLTALKDENKFYTEEEFKEEIRSTIDELLSTDLIKNQMEEVFNRLVANKEIDI